MRQQFASPQELGYPQGYAPNGMPQYAYPQQYPQPYGYPQYPQPAVYSQPARVVYFDESAYNPAGGQYIGQLPTDLDGSTLPPAGT